MSPAHHIPEAWPQLLTKDQLCAYLGGLSWDTVKKILPVAPLDLGANVLRYNRAQIDAWIARCPPRGQGRLQDSPAGEQDAAPEAAAAVDVDGDRRVASLDRARRRAQQGAETWRKTG